MSIPERQKGFNWNGGQTLGRTLSNKQCLAFNFNRTALKATSSLPAERISFTGYRKRTSIVWRKGLAVEGLKSLSQRRLGAAQARTFLLENPWQGFRRKSIENEPPGIMNGRTRPSTIICIPALYWQPKWRSDAVVLFGCRSSKQSLAGLQCQRTIRDVGFANRSFAQTVLAT